MGLAREKTIILITHSPPMVHACQNVVIVERGRIKAAGPTQKTLESLGATRVRPHPDGAPVVRVVSGGGAEAPAPEPSAV